MNEIHNLFLGVERSTGNVVQSVRTKYNDDKYQPILDAIFNAIGQIVNAAVNAIDQMAQNPLQVLQQISVLQVSNYYLVFNVIFFCIILNFYFFSIRLSWI